MNVITIHMQTLSSSLQVAPIRFSYMYMHNAHVEFANCEQIRVFKNQMQIRT